MTEEQVRKEVYSYKEASRWLKERGVDISSRYLWKLQREGRLQVLELPHRHVIRIDTLQGIIENGFQPRGAYRRPPEGNE